MVEVHRGARARAVEVDDVQLARAGLHPPARGVERIGVVHRALVELALGEAHGLALEDVDGRQQDHARTPAAPAHTATKLSSMRSPFREDFSGWNWTPNTDPRPTIVAKRSPYSVVPTTASWSLGRAA